MREPTPDAPPLSDAAAHDFVTHLLAVHNARMDVMDTHYDKIVELQQHLVRCHAEHEVKIDKLQHLLHRVMQNQEAHTEQMDMLRAILNGIKDLVRAKRN